MKRGKPLQRKTPLRSNSSLSGSSGLKRTGKLRQRSKKMDAIYVLRRPLVEKLLTERPLCEACPVWAKYDGLVTYNRRRSVDVHEVLSRGRSGNTAKAILDEANCICVCRACHDRIDRQSEVAETLGLLRPSDH